MKQKIQLTLILSGSLLLSSCSLVNRFSVKDSEPQHRVKTFAPEASPGQTRVLPEFGRASLFEPEMFILEYNRIAEVASLLEEGRASWYGSYFHGRLTASGEPYDMHDLTAAHPTLPFNTLVWVENKDNGQTVLVRVNDRGPYAGDRIIDLSREAAEVLGMAGTGLAEVNLYLARKAAVDDSLRKATLNVYTIQLGTFETGRKALAFAGRIKGARVEIVREDNTTYYGVFYGLYADRKEAYQTQRKLEQQDNFTAFVKELSV